MKLNSQVLHGSIVENKTIAGFQFSETAYDAGRRIAAHSHDFAYFCFVLRGHFDERCERRTRACRPLSLIFHPPHETHSDRFRSRTKCFNLQLSDSFFARTVQYSATINETPIDFGAGAASRIAAKIYREFRATDELSALVVEGLMFELLGDTLRRAKNNFKADAAPPVWLKRALELVCDRFSENLSLGQIAAAVGVHETHLAREFKRHYRSTVGEYLRRLRIEHACRCISASNISLAEIALLSGFADQSHFTKTFVQVMEMTPAAYRKLFRNR